VVLIGPPSSRLRPNDLTLGSTSLPVGAYDASGDLGLAGLEIAPDMDNPQQTFVVLGNTVSDVTVDTDLTGLASAGKKAASSIGSTTCKWSTALVWPRTEWS